MDIKSFKFNKLFKEEDSRFLLFCGLKFSMIFLAISFLIYYFVWVILSINSLYFESNGFFSGSDMQEAFFYSATQAFYNFGPIILGFFVCLFFVGAYIGKILIRPFKLIGEYAELKIQGEKMDFSPDTFSDYKLLTRFSEFFFRYLDDAIKRKVLEPNTIPPSFSKIHKPVFERVFFFHFMLFVFMVIIVTSYFTSYMSGEIHEQVINLAVQFLENKSEGSVYFLTKQKEITDSFSIVIQSLIFFSYLGLSFHLYSKVSGAIFGFFTTMRSFMKGNTKARVHLLGYAQIRPYSRKFNKYLDYIERECSKNKNTVE